MPRTFVWMLLAALLIVSAVMAADEVKQITGVVVFACPQGQALKVQDGATTVVMWVKPDCPKHDELVAQIKTLKPGDHVDASYYLSNEKSYVTRLAKL